MTFDTKCKKGYELNLISLVKQAPFLYDPSDKRFRDKLCKERQWEKIARIIGYPVTVQDCRARWKSLRDGFVKEYRKLEYSTAEESNWVYYNHLSFIKDVTRKSNKIRYFDGIGKEESQSINEDTVEPDFIELEIDGSPIEYIETEDHKFGCISDDKMPVKTELRSSRDSIYHSTPNKRKKNIEDFCNEPDSNVDNVSQFLRNLKEIVNVRDNSRFETENMLFMKSLGVKMEKLPKPVQRDIQMAMLSMVNTKLNENEYN